MTTSRDHGSSARAPGRVPGTTDWTALCRYDGIDVRVPVRHRQAGGELLVLLHGLGCAKGSFDGAFTAECLRDRSVLALDLPGHGDSGHGLPGSLHTLEAFAAVTRMVIRQLADRTRGYDLVHFGGHSMGGAVGVILARGWTGTGCAVSIDGNLTGEDCGLASRAIAGQDPSAYAAEGHSQLIAGLLEPGLPSMTAWAAWLARADPAAVHAAARSLVAWSESGKLLTWFNALERKALLYGDQEDKRHLTGRVDPAVTCQLPRCGHFPMIDNPGPLYQALSRALGKESQ